MLLSREKITQIRGETSIAFIETYSTPSVETSTKVSLNQDKCDEATSLSICALGSLTGHLSFRPFLKSVSFV